MSQKEGLFWIKTKNKIKMTIFTPPVITTPLLVNKQIHIIEDNIQINGYRERENGHTGFLSNFKWDKNAFLGLKG